MNKNTVLVRIVNLHKLLEVKESKLFSLRNAKKLQKRLYRRSSDEAAEEVSGGINSPKDGLSIRTHTTPPTPKTQF